MMQNGNQKLSLPNKAKQMAMMFKYASNPQKMAQEMLQSNPQLQSIIEANNGNYEQAFRSMAQQMNVDPNEIIGMLK